MLQIYTELNDKLLNNYINDVELFFEEKWKELCSHKEAKNIIKAIDNVEYVKNDSIKGSFDITTILNISTGCKALLIAINNPDAIVNFIETGNNVFNLALKLSHRYNINIYLPLSYKHASGDFDSTIMLDGKRTTVYNYLIK